MRLKAEKVVDPESIAWIEQREGSGSDEGYFESAWHPGAERGRTRPGAARAA